MDKNHDVITFILKYPNLRRPGVPDFFAIIKIAIMLLKKDSIKVHIIRKMH